MKKVVLSLAVLFSVALVSCGGNKAAEAVDSDTVVVVEAAAVEVDSACCDSAAADTAVVAEVVEAVAE